LYVVNAQITIPNVVHIAYAHHFPQDGKDRGNDETTYHAYTKTASADLQTWHRCLGHISADSVLHMVRKGMVKGMEITGDTTCNTLGLCEPCIKGKHACADIKR